MKEEEDEEARQGIGIEDRYLRSCLIDKVDASYLNTLK